MILDLQNTRLGRPGCELTYFFCSSISYELRKGHLDHLLKFYYDEFSQQLVELGDDVIKACYTFDELKKDFDDCYSFGFVMGCLHSHVSCLDYLDVLTYQNHQLNINYQTSTSDAKSSLKTSQGYFFSFIWSM